MNGNNFNTENFFGLQNLEALLSSVDAKKLGRDFGKKFADGIEQALKSSDAVKSGVSDYQKSLKELKHDVSDLFKDMKLDDKTRKSFEDSIVSSIQKAEKQANSLKQKLSDVYAEMEKESNKPVKDTERMLKLYEQITGLQGEYNILTSTTTDQIRLQSSDLKYQVHYEEMLNEQRELSLKKSEAKSKKDQAEIKALERKLELSKSNLAVEEQQNDNTRKGISERKSNYNEISNLDNQMIDEFKEGLEDAKKQTQSFFGTLKNGISSLSNYVLEGFDLFNKLANDTENRIGRLNQEFGDRWKTYNSVSKNIGGADFDDYQKAIYDATVSGAMRGMFNESELNQHLLSLSEYLFETKEAAIENSQLLAYGNKFLGLSSQSMQSIYNLEKLTNGDGFIRSQLETITKLQNSGLITSEEQLNQLTVLASSVAQDLSGTGLTGDAAKSLETSLTEVGAVLDSKMYSGAGQEYINTLLDALKHPEKGIELFGDSYSEAMRIASSGDKDVAWQLLDLSKNNSLASNIQGVTNASGFGISSVTLGEQFGNASLFNNLDTNWSQIQQERAVLNQMGYEGYLDKQQQEDSEEIDEETKRLNEKAVELANGNYTELIKQSESTQRIETRVKTIEHWVAVIGSTLGLLTGIEGISKLFGKDGGFTKLIEAGKNLFGGSSSLGSTLSTAFAPAGSGGAGLFGAGMGTTVLGAGLTVAGAGWAAYDGITGGINGITDENGNYIMEKGLGTGLTTAIGGKNINTESYQGNLTNSAKKSNTWGSIGSGAAKGALIGAGIGTFFGPGVGTAIGGAIGGLVGGIAGLFAGNQKNKEAEEYAKKQYEEQKKQTEINQEMLDIAKRGNAALSYRYAIDTSVMGNVGSLGESAPVIPSSGTGGGDYPWNVTSTFHDGRTLSNGDKSAHNGIDFGVSLGTPIGAPMAGTVLSYQVDSKNTYPNGSKSGGTWLYVKGEDGVTYGFGHLSSIASGLTKKGAKVSYGQLIGLSGNTGYSTGPHLHFSTKTGGSYTNPEPYITQGLFSPSGGDYSSSSSSSSSDMIDTSNLSSQATMRTASRTHYIASGGLDESSSGSSSIDISPIVAGLSEVNNTIKELGERQDAQQRILDALTVKPIPSLGI